MPYNALDQSLAAAAPVITHGAPLTSVGQTLATLRAQLQRMLGGRSDLSEDDYNGWINDAYIDLATSLDIADLRAGFSFPLVGSQPFYLLPAVVEAVRGVSIIDTTTYSRYGGRPLSPTDAEAYRRHPDETDEPVEYFREGQMLVLWPTPQNVRTVAVDFTIRPLLLEDDTDSPILPFEWHRAILLGARSVAYDSLQEFEHAAVAENRYISYVRRRTDRAAKEDSARTPIASVPRRRSDLWRDRRLPNHEP